MRGSFISVGRWKETADFEDGKYSLCLHLSLEAMKPEDHVYVIQDFYTYDGCSPAGQTVGCVACGKKWDAEEDVEDEILENRVAFCGPDFDDDLE